MKKKLIVLSMIILFVAVSLTATFISLAVKDIQEEAALARLMETTQLLLLEAKQYDSLALSEFANTWGENGGQYRVTFINKAGKVLGDSSLAEDNIENHSNRPEVQAAWQTGQGYDQRRSSSTGIPSIYAAAASQDYQLLVRLAIPLHEIEVLQKAVINRAIWGIILSLIIALIMVTSLSKQILQPLYRLQNAAQKIAEGNYSIRVEPEKHEIGELGKRFNTMADVLQENMSRLQQQRLLLNTVLNHVVTGILAIDYEGNLLLANPLARLIYRLPNDLPANSINKALLYRDLELWNLLESTLKTGIGKEAELIRNKMYQVTTAILPMQEKHGVVMAIQDMTRIKKLENLRSEFIANATHELRTPLTSIQGYIETLINHKNISEELQTEILSILEIESHRLSHLIDDMLTLSEIENRPQNINEESLDPLEIAQAVIQLLKPQAEQNNLDLILEASPTPTIWARKDWLQRMLINLVDNAIKYNQPGGKVIVAIEAPNPNRLKISVSDTGVGITADNLERIFERFYRVDKSHTLSPEGTGLGLAIVKHMVQLYGGTIQATSQLGIGTCLVIELPTE